MSVRSRLAAGAAVLVLFTACAVAPTRSDLAEAAGATGLPPEQARIEVRALAGRFSGLLEGLADEITAQGGDPGTRLEMTRFKANAVPAMQGALFQRDPVAALVDAWALLAQMAQWLDARAGTVHPETAATARARLAAMEDEVAALWGRLAGADQVEPTRAEVEAWARDHPLTASLAARETTAPLLARLTARTGLRPLSAAAALLEDTQDLAARFDLQTAYLPKAGRWQAEQLYLEALTDPSLRPDLSGLRPLLTSLEAATRAAAGVSGMVARERTAVLAAARQERLEAQAWLTGERVAATGDLRAERAALVEDLRGERQAAFADADRVGAAAIDHAFDRMDRLVARALMGGALLLGAFLLLQVLLLGVWARRVARRREVPGT